ncbi:MAG: hypothetical protein E7271_10030 [Lachnospiraceae bacterium]|nr:hypothetical protein [Lachnospiraceae bacterium]
MKYALVKHPNFKYIKLSEADNPMYASKFIGNEVEIFSGTREELIELGFLERKISNNLKRTEDSAATFLANAKLRKMTGEELCEKIRKKRNES